MKTIRFNLSKKSIAQAIKDTRAQEARIRHFCELFSQRVAEEGRDAARAALTRYCILPDGDILSNVKADCVRPGVWRVWCYAPTPEGKNSALYVEYGTGPVGARSNPPDDGQKYKATGWWTTADGKDMANLYGWVPIILPDGNTVYYTEGQESKPFMHDSMEHIQKKEVVDRIVAECIKEVFGND